MAVLGDSKKTSPVSKAIGIQVDCIGKCSFSLMNMFISIHSLPDLNQLLCSEKHKKFMFCPLHISISEFYPF